MEGGCRRSREKLFLLTLAIPRNPLRIPANPYEEWLMAEYGFKKLVVWENARKLRKMIYDIAKPRTREEGIEGSMRWREIC